MAELKSMQEPELEDADSGETAPDPDRTDLLIAIPAPLGGEGLSSTVAKLEEACRLLPNISQATLAFPGDADDQPPPEAVSSGSAARCLRFVHYPPPPTEPGSIPWLVNAAAYGPISTLAGQMGARACTILGTDLGFNRDSLTAEKLTLLMDPAVEGNFDLAMPVYATAPFDGLLNKSILYPLTRALYGYRVYNPLGNEFQMSSKLYPALAAGLNKDSSRPQGRLPWPATIAVSRNLKICQVRLGKRQPSSADGIELVDALAQLAGPLFVDMEDNAALWQHIRGSREVPAFGRLEDTTGELTEAVDVRRMLEAFQLGVANLRDVWSLILPPITLLELKKLSRLPSVDFHMEDVLWARIVYDFALAHRLRNIHRSHLFGALTPLYLGWVASYGVAINKSGMAGAQERVESLARVYESEKPYLLSRWRWPDRFHP